MSLEIGEIIDGKYRIVRELGSGAMGAVYEGENVRIHRRVAIKVLLPSVADQGDTVQRFEREAQAAGRIGSEHIVEVLDLGRLPDGGLYMVMEFLIGQTLSGRVRGCGRLKPRQLVPIAQQLLTGLEAAHEAKIIHRDLKPDNVFICEEHANQKDFVKILDFGISKFNPLNAEDGMGLTRPGAVMGTPYYMSPEQAKGSKDVDQRSDLYAVGVILYESITGQVPFHAGTFNELIFRIVLQAPPPPEHFVPDLDPAFGRIIRRAMSRDMNERFGSAAEFRDVLSVWLHTGRDTIEAPDQPFVAPPGRQLGDNDLDWDDEDGKATVMMDGLDEDVQTTVMREPPEDEDENKATVMVDRSAAVPVPPAPRPAAGGAQAPPVGTPQPSPAAGVPAPAFGAQQPSPAAGGQPAPWADSEPEEIGPIAGVPTQSRKNLAIIGAALGVAAVVVVVMIAVLTSDSDSSASEAKTATTADEAVESAEVVAAADEEKELVEQSGEEQSGEEQSGEEQSGEEQGEDNGEDAEKDIAATETTPKKTPVAAAPQPTSPPPSKPKSDPVTPPPSKTPKTKKGKGTNRRIATEL